MLEDLFEGGYEGGVGGEMEIAELKKALTVGHDLAAFGAQNAGAVMPVVIEDLSPVLKSQTFKQKHIKLWNALAKVGTGSTLAQFTQLHEYGNVEQGWIDEGALPPEDDSIYSREHTKIRYLGTTRRLSLQSMLVKTQGESEETRQIRNGTMWLLKLLERSLFEGNSDVIPTEIDGLKKQIGASGVVHDLRGGVLTEETMEDVYTVLRDEPNYGTPSICLSSLRAKRDLKKVFFPRMRETFGKQITPGFTFKEMEHDHGNVAYEDSVFIKEGGVPVAAGQGDASKRPLPPVIAVQPALLGADTAPLWLAADAGDYIFKIVAVNKYGRSTPVTTNAVTAAAGKGIRTNIADGGQGGVQAATGYIVYRSIKDGAASTCKEMVRVSRTGLTQNIDDLNADIPGTSTVYLLEMDADAICWRQLLPFTRIVLPMLDLSKRWAQVMFGGLEIGIPRHHGIIKNVLPDAGAIG